MKLMFESTRQMWFFMGFSHRESTGKTTRQTPEDLYRDGHHPMMMIWLVLKPPLWFYGD